MVNSSPYLRGRVRDTYPAPSLAAQLLLGRRPLIDDEEDEGEDIDGLSGFNLSRVPRSRALLYNDAHGYINELSYSMEGRLHHYVRRDGLVTRVIGEEPSSAPRPIQNNLSRGSEPDGREPEEFNAGFSTLEDPFSGSGRRSTVGGLGHDEDSDEDDDSEEEFPYGGTFAAAIGSTLMPDSTGVPSVTSQAATDFIQRHTQPVTDDDTNKSPNTECPICLEPPSATHGCVQITNIPECTHLIGRECLEELLTHSAQSKKACPLCRTEWVAADGPWSTFEGWQRIVSGLDDSRSELQGLVGFDGSPRDRFARLAMDGFRLAHDILHRGDRRPAGPLPVNHPEVYSSSAGRSGRTGGFGRL